MKKIFKILIVALMCLFMFTISGCNSESSSYYSAAKSMGFSGSKREWNKQVEEAKKQFNEGGRRFDYYADFSFGTEDPDSSTEHNARFYINVTTHKRFVWDGSEWYLPNTEKASLDYYSETYAMFNDGIIRLVTIYGLSNSAAVVDVDDITIKDVSLSTTKIDFYNESDFYELFDVVITLDNDEKINISHSYEKIVKSHNIKRLKGDYDVLVKVNNKDYDFKVSVVLPEYDFKLSNVHLSSSFSILVVDNGNGNYDYKLDAKFLRLEYEPEGYVNEVPITKHMVKDFVLSRGLNHRTIKYRGFDVPAKFYLATPEEINKAKVSRFELPNDEKYFNGQFCEKGTKFISSDYIYISLEFGECDVAVYERVTYKNLLWSDCSNVGTSRRAVYFYEHSLYLENPYAFMPISVVDLENRFVNIKAESVVPIGTDKEDILFEVEFYDEEYNKYTIIKRAVDYTKDEIDTSKPGRHYYNIEFKGNTYVGQVTVYDDLSKVNHISNEYYYETFNIDSVDELNLKVYDIADTLPQIDDYFAKNTPQLLNVKMANLEFDPSIENETQLVTFTILGQKMLLPLINNTNRKSFKAEDSFYVNSCNDLSGLENVIKNKKFSYDMHKINYSLDMFDLRSFNPSKLGPQTVKFTYNGFTKFITICVLPKSAPPANISLKGFTVNGFRYLHIYDNYINFDGDFLSDYTYDKASGILTIHNWQCTNNALGASGNELVIKVDEAKGTYELVPIYNDTPIKEYTTELYGSEWTLKIYSDNRFELYNKIGDVTLSGKYSELGENLLYCGLNIRLFNDKTFAMC